MAWFALAAFVVIAAAAIRIYDFVSGESLLGDAWRGFRVRRADIVELDRAGAAHRGQADLVVCLTTIPSRMPYLADTLKSLLLQTRPPREIQLNIPAFSRREDVAYVVPSWLEALHCVRIVRCSDFGPATKFIPTLLAEPPDRLVVVVDDDRIYPARLIEDLEQAAHENPRAAFGTCGWIVPKDLIDRPTNFSNLSRRPPAPIMSTALRQPREVDILKGVSGYIVRPRFFDLRVLSDYSAAPTEAFFADDIWLSGHCKAPKYVIPTSRTNFHPRHSAELYRATSLGRIDADKRKNTVTLQYFGAACWRVGGPRNLA
jgi:hypothetical protein